MRAPAPAPAPPRPAPRDPVLLGGREIEFEVLEHGRRAYDYYCRACHGSEGDGQGPAAFALFPPPSDLTRAIFKFSSVPAGELPTDSDLRRVVRRGLQGTAMMPWKIPEPDLNAVVHYIKTFAEDWRDFEAGEPIPPAPDPWQERMDQARHLGEQLYHGLAQCQACHPAYATRREIYQANLELRGVRLTELRPDLYAEKESDTAFGYPLPAPDLIDAPIRAGSKPLDLYRLIAAGVGGTSMPTWHGALEDDQIWALAHYSAYLIGLRRDRAGRRALLERLDQQTPFDPAAAIDG